MRALVIVLDGFGVGAAPDAGEYGDEGSDTLAHVLDRCPDLELPALWSLGLGRAIGRDLERAVRGSYGRMRERAAGKDSTVGHWEIAGAVVDEPFTVFERFPDELVQAIERDADVRFLGNYPASGTAIIEQLGALHIRTRAPILYTSADSVLQIAAHEEVLPLARLYDICRIARTHADAYRIGRVIARPFVGEPGSFRRTPRRHDFSMAPPPTVLDAIVEAGLPVVGVGKIADLFAGRGVTTSLSATSNADAMRRTDDAWNATSAGLVFTNLNDFDTVYGHRRDVPGYAGALAEFDEWLGRRIETLDDGDLLVVTSDHGNDPTFSGTDHTREYVPLVVRWGRRTDDLGCRPTFADVGATLAAFFGLSEPWPVGEPLFDETELRASA